MKPHGKDSEGVTLVEIIFAMTVFLIISGICVQLFSASIRRFNIINVLQDVQKNGTIGMDRFARDFSETSDYLVINETEGSKKCIFFPSKRDKQGNFDYAFANDLAASSPWKSWIIYYLYPDKGNTTVDNKQLYLLARKVTELDHKPAESEVITMITSLRDAQVAARNIALFNVKSESSGEMEVYKATIETESKYSGQKCTFNAERIFLLNSM
jgi:Tfp pilus assembly protein FimT